VAADGETGSAADARGSQGVLIGDGLQVNYFYNGTWTDGFAPPPLVSGSGAVDSPYRGLSAFGDRDAAFFFGREAAATEIIERMARCLAGPSLMVISGVSGAGKSSLLRAGVLPRVRGEGLAGAAGSAAWPCLVFTPGPEPLDELAFRVARLAGASAAAVRRDLDDDPAGFALTARQAALAPGGAPDAAPGRLLLVVDQFEQLFTQCPDESQQRAFITALGAAAAGGPDPQQAPAALVVLGVRADFEARCAEYPALARPVQDRYLVTSMTQRQLRMAITEPARTQAASVTDDLAGVLLAEAGAASGAGVLPLLSHALDQAWRRRAAGTTLTLADYERTGGIEGAVGASAQQAYDHLTPAQQAAAREVFLRLTATGPDGTDTAGRATRAELTAGRDPAGARDVEAVLEAFTKQRLLILAADSVQISHEVLLSAWPLLRDEWLAETRADRIVRTRLRTATAEWTDRGRDSSYLYAGSLLDTAAAMAARAAADPARYPPLSPDERDFLGASERARRGRSRRVRGAIAILAAMVVGLAAVAVVAVAARQSAVRERDAETASQLITRSEALGDSNPELARLEAVAAWRIDPTQQARYAMLSAARLPGIDTLTATDGASIEAVAFSPDGKVLAAGLGDGTVRLVNPATRATIGRPLATGTSAVASLAFSPDGRTLAVGTANGIVQLWNVATRGTAGPPLRSGTRLADAVAFSPDGTILATGNEDGTVRLWHAAAGQPDGAPLDPPAPGTLAAAEAVAFSPDAKTLAVSTLRGTVQLWNLATRAQAGPPLAVNGDLLEAVAFSPHGPTLATGSYGGDLQLWDADTRQEIGSPVTDGSGSVVTVAFSPDGALVATGTQDGGIQLWDAASRQQVGTTLTGGTRRIASVAFSPDGRTLATGGFDGVLRLWSVPTAVGDPTGSMAIPAAPQPDSSGSTIDAIAFSPDGRTLATGSWDDTAQLWNVTGRRPIGAPLAGDVSWVASVAFSPDGHTLATGSYGGTALLWNVASRQPAGTPLEEHAGVVSAVAFSPDGTILATGQSGTVRLWAVASRRLIGTLRLTGGIGALAFSPDGRILAAGDGSDVQIWDVATRRSAGALLTGSQNAITSVAFSPDGRTLAAGSRDDNARLWSVATRQQVGAPLTGDLNWVNAVAFSPDGQILATGGEDGTTRLWDVATQQQIGPSLTGGNDTIGAVAFSPDGQTLATGNSDGTVQLWDVAGLAHVVRQLCAAAGTTFTQAEWAIAAPGLPYQHVCP
jgi:WD40 repeat protein